MALDRGWMTLMLRDALVAPLVVGAIAIDRQKYRRWRLDRRVHEAAYGAPTSDDVHRGRLWRIRFLALGWATASFLVLLYVLFGFAGAQVQLVVVAPLYVSTMVAAGTWSHLRHKL